MNSEVVFLRGEKGRCSAEEAAASWVAHGEDLRGVCQVASSLLFGRALSDLPLHSRKGPPQSSSTPPLTRGWLRPELPFSVSAAEASTTHASRAFWRVLFYASLNFENCLLRKSVQARRSLRALLSFRSGCSSPAAPAAEESSSQTPAAVARRAAASLQRESKGFAVRLAEDLQRRVMDLFDKNPQRREALSRQQRRLASALLQRNAQRR